MVTSSRTGDPRLSPSTSLQLKREAKADFREQINLKGLLLYRRTLNMQKLEDRMSDDKRTFFKKRAWVFQWSIWHGIQASLAWDLPWPHPTRCWSIWGPWLSRTSCSSILPNASWRGSKAGREYALPLMQDLHHSQDAVRAENNWIIDRFSSEIFLDVNYQQIFTFCLLDRYKELVSV